MTEKYLCKECGCDENHYDSIERVRRVLPKWQHEAKESQCACYGDVIDDLIKALDGK